MKRACGAVSLSLTGGGTRGEKGSWNNEYQQRQRWEGVMSTPQQPVGASLVVLFDRDRRLLFEHPEAVGKAFSKEYVERELYPRAFRHTEGKSNAKKRGSLPKGIYSVFSDT